MGRRLSVLGSFRQIDQQRESETFVHLQLATCFGVTFLAVQSCTVQMHDRHVVHYLNTLKQRRNVGQPSLL